MAVADAQAAPAQPRALPRAPRGRGTAVASAVPHESRTGRAVGEGLVLHITNGDVAGGLLQHAIAGRLIANGPVVPWLDVLHEGPVCAGRGLDELSRERAAFIAACGWGPLSEVASSFERRDALLRTAPTHDEVVLWFEHDLYDQLQLIQLLDWFAAHPQPGLSLICEA